MKRIQTVALFALLIVMPGCSGQAAKDELIHSDLKQDTEQVLGVMDKAHEDRRDVTAEENDLINKYMEKYKIGQFSGYEMNDLEKNIVSEMGMARFMTGSDEALASEKDAYEISRDKIKDFMDAKKIPKGLDKIPTYEPYEGIHSAIKEDAEKLFVDLEEFIQSDATDASDTYYNANSFLSKYKDGFQLNGKQFLLNEESFEVVYVVERFVEDCDDGGLTQTTVNEFERVKDKVIP